MNPQPSVDDRQRSVEEMGERRDRMDARYRFGDLPSPAPFNLPGSWVMPDGSIWHVGEKKNTT